MSSILVILLSQFTHSTWTSLFSTTTATQRWYVPFSTSSHSLCMLIRDICVVFLLPSGNSNSRKMCVHNSCLLRAHFMGSFRKWKIILLIPLVTKFPHVCDDGEAHREFQIISPVRHVYYGKLPLFWEINWKWLLCHRQWARAKEREQEEILSHFSTERKKQSQWPRRALMQIKRLANVCRETRFRLIAHMQRPSRSERRRLWNTSNLLTLTFLVQ
jgi:hypothetical protein